MRGSKLTSETLFLEMTGADPIGTLDALQAAGAELWDVERAGELVLRFCIRAADLKIVEQIAAKHGDKVKISHRIGLLTFMRRVLQRPVLVVGLTLLVVFSIWLPGKVLFVQVEGNVELPDRLIAEKAAQCGIRLGAHRRQVRSEKMKNALLDAMPQLQWAGVNTYGCVAVITVRERTDSQPDPTASGPASIVALRDGIIKSMTVTKGNPLCKPGQAVKAGQVLVSGYTDLGLHIRADRAEAEVYGETKQKLSAVIPAIYENRTELRSSEKKFSLIIGKKRINFYNSSGILDTTCVKIYTEKYLTLPGGFVLPIALATEEWITYETNSEVWQEGPALLEQSAQQYLLCRMIAGRIEGSSLVSSHTEDVYRLDGIYHCCEMIGILRIEEIGTEYGKSS